MEIKVVRQILEENKDCHAELQKIFNLNKVLVLNIMGSPGCGKTTFILRLIEEIREKYNVGVIEGDVAGKVDSQKIAAMGIPVVQLNTEGACHLESASIKNVLQYFNLDKLDILIVENIGNLICTAEFEIGEDLKIVLLSIPEGDDKVEKYPLMFLKADTLILSKFDMMKYFNFYEERVLEDCKRLNEDMEILRVNSLNGEGVERFVRWIKPYIKK